MAQEIDASVSRYISMAQAIPELTRNEEHRLASAWREEADKSARDALVRVHLRAVVAIALKYRRYGLPLSELIAEGNFGLVHALSKFEPERGNRFVTYAAYWIRAYVLNYIIRSWSLVGVGSGALRSKMFFKLRRERVRIQNLVGDGEQALELLAKRLDVSRGALSEMLVRLEARDLSLDAKVFDDGRGSLIDAMPALEENQEQSLASSELQNYMRHAVHSALDALDKRELYIAKHRLMADREEELSLAEIGRRLGVSRERARQLEARTKRKLRSRIAEISQTSGSGALDLESAA